MIKNIKNIYWMMVYAFRGLEKEEIRSLSTEKFDSIYDLFCEIFNICLAEQIKKGLRNEYVIIREKTPTIKGKLNIDETLKSNLINTTKVICEYDEFSVNTYMNKIIKSTAILLINSNKIENMQRKEKLKRNLKYLGDIDTIDLKRINWNLIKYSKNNISYRVLINVCHLIISGTILIQNEGKIVLSSFLDDQSMHRLYEKFILEYYKVHFSQLKPSAKHINWNVKCEEESLALLPNMITDITLQYEDRILIIDAKYYSNIFQKNYMNNIEKFKSNNLYQIFTYVKNADANQTGKVKGMLLYAKTDENFIKPAKYNMNNNEIFIDSLDLDEDFDLVKKKLNKIVQEILIE